MSEFDPFDDQLASALNRRAGAAPTSTEAAHAAVVHRAGAIRRRRMAIGGGGTMAVLLVGGILLLPRGTEEIGPAVTGDVLPSFDDTTSVPGDEPTDEIVDGAAPVTVDLSIPDTSIPDDSVPVDSVAGHSGTTDVISSVPGRPVLTTGDTIATGATTPGLPASTQATGTTATSTAGTVATTEAPPPDSTVSPTTAASPSTSSTPSTSTSPSTSSAPSTSEPDPTLAPFTDTYSSAGGSITVHWNGSAFSLQVVSPAPGYTSEIEDQSATRVRVRFRSADDDSRIEVRVDDGQLIVDIS